MSASRHQTVVQGEASETDSEEEIYLTSVTSVALSTDVGLKVPGEASETDEEGSLGEKIHMPKSVGTLIPFLIIMRNEEQMSPAGKEEKPMFSIQSHSRYSTLLQHKLLESNAHLCHNIHGTIKHIYQAAAKELGALTNQFSSSQNGIISASHSIRLILDDLRTVSEKIDIIASCNLLPNIRMDSL
ncbi:biogenesis of lysosome-related organelles complex 1 subunit 3 [Microcaecilia unicolor]|uniref:Biogenesis of lysosome-related organelles complex 1 subunit 3 n=1 Tax=Microcaecilia unicolor TaxID=1415580 RepID=A0A6P7ZFM2_9AMPH|nr:biogenesis of lysosome-related organelles complex 1 subunit 3 [Microcaecilia unicolor]XP_030074210.1 biogenesis of lysosome-related organelles complex 1 subunit 3 [Microcaecilia unicolor]